MPIAPPRGLTLDQHRQLGRRLKDMRDEVLPLVVELPYDCRSSARRKAMRALSSLDALRCALDAQAAKDLGAEFDTRLYYPGQQP